MVPSCTYEIYNSTSVLPDGWDRLARGNIFLSKAYLEILEISAPNNMICRYIGFFLQGELVGISLSQILDITQLESFGERDRRLKSKIRNFIFKRFCSHVMFIGNNMLTGQNAFVFSENIPTDQALTTLHSAIISLRQSFAIRGTKIHLTSLKDFDAVETRGFQLPQYKEYYLSSTQPNMVLEIPSYWEVEQDYVKALQKKYRDQYKRARKKLDGIEKRKMKLEEIIAYEDAIYDLYFHVAKNAPFNTFFLARNHFKTFKAKLKDNFLFYGYFDQGKLIGFNTLIKNGKTLDTYFLGYDDTVQKEKMLYLNMLYDMIGYGISKKFETIIFGRTALEIKSSVGAKPQKMYGLIEHSNSLINSKMSIIFPYLEPEVKWKQRNPFL